MVLMGLAKPTQFIPIPGLDMPCTECHIIHNNESLVDWCLGHSRNVLSGWRETERRNSCKPSHPFHTIVYGGNMAAAGGSWPVACCSFPLCPCSIGSGVVNFVDVVPLARLVSSRLMPRYGPMKTSNTVRVSHISKPTVATKVSVRAKNQRVTRYDILAVSRTQCWWNMAKRTRKIAMQTTKPSAMVVRIHAAHLIAKFRGSLLSEMQRAARRISEDFFLELP
jgi:hypothetical protein